MNYEQFQLETSAVNLAKFLQSESPEMIVIDEIHYAKQTSHKSMSRRRELIASLVTNANVKNSSLHVLGMSATPVINNLQEGRSMIELITTKEFNDLNTHASVNNAMRVHQHLKSLGIEVCII